VVDGAATRLGPFPGNEPPYLAYGLLAPDGPRFVLNAVAPRAAIGTLLVGSDGAADLLERQPLDELWSEDRYFANPDAVRRRLTVLTRPSAAGPGLADDATLVVVRRAPAAEAMSCASG